MTTGPPNLARWVARCLATWHGRPHLARGPRAPAVAAAAAAGPLHSLPRARSSHGSHALSPNSQGGRRCPCWTAAAEARRAAKGATAFLGAGVAVRSTLGGCSDGHSRSCAGAGRSQRAVERTTMPSSPPGAAVQRRQCSRSTAPSVPSSSSLPRHFPRQHPPRAGDGTLGGGQLEDERAQSPRLARPSNDGAT